MTVVALLVPLTLAACQEQSPAPAPAPNEAAPAEPGTTPPATAPATAAAESDAEPPASTPPAEAPSAGMDPPPEDAMVFTSNDGAYRIACRVLADPIPVNEPFDMEIWVMDLEADQAASHAGVFIDAAMPHHRHGMNQYPVVTALADGRYHVDGMLFHMPGYWEIYVDVENGPVVERGQVSVDVE
ncbi:MAG: hypothetical protein F6K11_00285 [Leptolyngbya sp. SIO3F4]|nr:hypothetical protein [Leptolyngbya sp. SIO3F4]